MIVPCLFRRQLFIHSVTPPTQPSNFHETISCNVSPNLQPANFYELSTYYRQMELPSDLVTLYCLLVTNKAKISSRMVFYLDKRNYNRK